MKRLTKLQKIIKNKIFIYYCLSCQNKDFISVIIPYHRKKDFFQETINSIQKQTYKNIEILIIYDDDDKGELNYVKKF